MAGTVEPSFLPQTHYIHPRVTGDLVRYFEWMGAAHYTADRRSGAMHGKVFLLDSIYAGIDETHVYGRMDFANQLPEGDFEIVVNLESWADNAPRPRRALRLNVEISSGKISTWKIGDNGDTLSNTDNANAEAAVALSRHFEFKLPLPLLYATPRQSSANGPSANERSGNEPSPAATKLRLRFSLWQNRLPVDALPVEGWMELLLLPEDELMALSH
jgi:hypothetical protein